MSSSRILVSWRARVDFSMTQARTARNPPFVQLATVDSSQVVHGGKPIPKCRTVVFRGFLEGPLDPNESSLCSQPLKIITDRRSEKVAQILENSAVELIYWFPSSNEQFRISGRAEFHSFNSKTFNAWAHSKFQLAEGVRSDERYKNAVLDQWRQLKDQAREQFWWNEPGVNFNGLDYSKDRPYDFESKSKRRHVDEVEGADGVRTEGEADAATCAAAETAPAQASGKETASERAKIPAGGRDAETGEILDPPDTFLLLLVHPQEVKYLRLGDNFASLDRLDPSTGEWRAERQNP